jgi:hypothetical protein
MTIVKIINCDYPNIEVQFSNGTVAILDISNLLKDISNTTLLKRILNPNSFNTVKLESGTLVWFGVGFNPDEIWDFYKSKEYLSTGQYS